MKAIELIELLSQKMSMWGCDVPVIVRTEQGDMEVCAVLADGERGITMDKLVLRARSLERMSKT